MSDTGRFRSIVLATVLGLWALPSVVLGQSAAPSGAPSPGAPTPVMPMPADPAPLAPGSYVSDVGSGTSVTFDVADDTWTGAGGQMVVMDRDVAGDAGELIVTTFAGSVLTDPCERDVSAVEEVRKDAAAFTDWLLAQPWAVATTSPTTLGGEPATQVDISGLNPACPDQPMFVWLYLDGGPYRLAATEGVRVIAQDRGEDLILVTAETLHAASLPTFLEAATPVIESMSFGEPVELPSPGSSAGAA